MNFAKSTVTSSTSTTQTGADATLTVPSGEVWEVFSVVAHLVTSAQAGNRQLIAGASINSLNLRGLRTSFVQTASIDAYYEFAEGLPLASSETDNFVTAPSPKRFLGPGDTIWTSTDNLQSSDQVTVSAAYVKHPAN